MPPTLADRLEHSGTAIANICKMTAPLTRESFADDFVIHSIGRRWLLEFISVASRHIPPAAKSS